MFDVKILGSIKGMDGGEEMRFELQNQIRKALTDQFSAENPDNPHAPFSVWEVFVTERQVDLNV